MKRVAPQFHYLAAPEDCSLHATLHFVSVAWTNPIETGPPEQMVHQQRQHHHEPMMLGIVFSQAYSAGPQIESVPTTAAAHEPH